MDYTNLIWRDGQPHSERFDDIYYSVNDEDLISGEREFQHVFFENNGLPERWQNDDDFVIAELGFGSGLNCLLTIHHWLSHLEETGKEKCLHYIAIERYPLSPSCISELISRYSFLTKYCEVLLADYPAAIEATHVRRLFNGRVIIHFRFMDVEQALDDDGLNVDVWYLDGFSPAKNPDMWSQDVCHRIARNSRQGSTCSTYTAAGFVRRNLVEAGFTVKKVEGYGRKREMLVARLSDTKDKTYLFDEKPWYRFSGSKFLTKNATVIGAGIAGLSTAYALIKRGWHVTIIDKHDAIAQGASSNPAALVYPRLAVDNIIDTNFYITAFYHALHELKELQAGCTKKFWFDTGISQVVDEAKVTAILQKFQFNNKALSQDVCSPYAGELQSGQALLNVVEGGVVVPKNLCDAIMQSCSEKLTIIKADIDEVIKQGDDWHCISGGRVVNASEVVIVASGSDLPHLNELPELPLEKIRGQVASLVKNKFSATMTCAISADVYITPLIEQCHYLGATYSRNNHDDKVSSEENNVLLDKVNNDIVKLIKCESYRLSEQDSWVGFRCMSKDRVPVVGPVPDVDFYEKEYHDICHGIKNKQYPSAQSIRGLFLSLAHGSRGFTSSFLSAEILASQIVGEPSPVSSSMRDYLTPSRFIVNDMKRR